MKWQEHGPVMSQLAMARGICGSREFSIRRRILAMSTGSMPCPTTFIGSVLSGSGA